jgi:uncharacterized protein (TIGR02145 family)
MKYRIAFLFFLFGSVSSAQQLVLTQIDVQTWATTNLNVVTFRNGDPIRYVTNNDEWIRCHSNGVPAYCYYNNDPRNGETYGAIYNWFAMADPRGLAPEGFRVANDIDWAILYNFLKRGIYNYQDLGVSGIKLKSTHSWTDNGVGEDQYGMSILPGGSRMLNGSYAGLGNSVGLWSRDTITYYGYSKSNAYSSYSIYFQSQMNDMLFKKENKRTGFYVRCIYGIEPVIITDSDAVKSEYELYQEKLKNNN